MKISKRAAELTEGKAIDIINSYLPEQFFALGGPKLFPYLTHDAAEQILKRNLPDKYAIYRLYDLPECHDLNDKFLLSLLKSSAFGLYFSHKLYAHSWASPHSDSFIARILQNKESYVYDFFYRHKLADRPEFKHLIPAVVEQMIKDKNVYDFFHLELDKYPETSKYLKEIAKMYLSNGDIRIFVQRGLDKKLPDVFNQAMEDAYKDKNYAFFFADGFPHDKIPSHIRSWLAQQQQIMEPDADYSDARPEQARAAAEKLYEQGFKTFIHTGSAKELMSIHKTVGEICVSSWDLSSKAFTHDQITLAAVFEGRLSHYFDVDVYSYVDKDGLRRVGVDKGEEKQHDEGWFNPSRKGNKLVGYVVIGIDYDKQKQKHMEEIAQEMAEKNGVTFIRISSSPWDLETAKTPAFQEIVPEQNKYWEEKYQGVSASMKQNQLSCRAGIEQPSGGGSVGISTSVRKFWRNHFKGVAGMQGPNDTINYIIALDYANATPVHRFLLKSNEIGEIRKSNSFYYIAAIRSNKRHDVIVVQPTMKEAPAEISKGRLTQDWLDKVYRGEIKRK